MGSSRQEYWSGVPLPSPFNSLLSCKPYTSLSRGRGSCDGSGEEGWEPGLGGLMRRLGGCPRAWRARGTGTLPFAKFSGQDHREQPFLEGFVAGGEQASVSAPSQTWKLVSLSVCLSAPWSDRSWEEAAGCVRHWRCVPAGPLQPPSRFQRLQATGACHRKQGNGFPTLQEARDVTG